MLPVDLTTTSEARVSAMCTLHAISFPQMTSGSSPDIGSSTLLTQAFGFDDLRQNAETRARVVLGDDKRDVARCYCRSCLTFLPQRLEAASGAASGNDR